MRPGIGFFALAFLVGLPFAGQAAPQALGLVAMDQAVPLHCEAGVCRAEFTSFCLQKSRPFPAKGTAYEVAQAGGLSLVLSDRDGRTRLVDAAGLVDIRTPRAGHAAVTISLDASELAKLGAHRVAVRVDANVTLTPGPQAGDSAPQSLAELGEAAGWRRALGADLIDGSNAVERVHGLTALINTVPRLIDRDAGAKARLWAAALQRGLARATPKRLQLAAGEYERCWEDRVVQLGGYSAHECLRRRHDELMGEEVKRYWRASDPGS